MKTALILTLGTRDIQLNKLLVDSNPELYNERSFPYARKLGAFLYDKENFKSYQDNVSYPIIKLAFEYVLNEHDKIDELIIIAIDQAESEGETFYQNDSIEFAKVLEQRIIPIFYNKDKANKKILKISIEKATRYVATLDVQFDFWQEKIKKSKKFKDIYSYDKIYLCNQGGIDAVNNALLINSLDSFGDSLVVLSVNEKTKLCTNLKITNQYLKESEKKKLLAFLENYNYSAITAIELPNENVKWIIKYAEQRLNFNFKKCVSFINELNKDEDYKTNTLINIRNITSHEKELLKELYINAKIKYTQESYVDFLLRFFRIFEAITEEKVKKYLNIEFTHKNWGNKISSFVELPENKELKIYLEKAIIEEQKLDYIKANTAVYISVINFFESDSILNKLYSLKQMRNKSIGAHDFQPVSKELIDMELAKNGYSVEQMFQFFDTEFGITENPFDKINEKIKSLL